MYNMGRNLCYLNCLCVKDFEVYHGTAEERYKFYLIVLPNNALPSERASQLDVLTSAAVRLFRPENVCFSAAGNLDETDERMITEALRTELSV